MQKCIRCGQETVQTINGECSRCYKPYEDNLIINRAIYKQAELRTWQCPFCKTVYCENMPFCNCQKLLIEKNDNSKQRVKAD